MKYFFIERLDSKNDAHRAEVVSSIFHILHKYFVRYYPNFAEWYQQKVILGFCENTRAIFVVREQNTMKVYGVAVVRISQRSTQDNKISCFFVAPEATFQGIGTQLMNQSLGVFHGNRWSNCVIITIPEEKMLLDKDGKSFANFISKFGFRLTSKSNGKYRPNKTEYIFTADLYLVEDTSDIL